jgi:hypothetical protein
MMDDPPVYLHTYAEPVQPGERTVSISAEHFRSIVETVFRTAQLWVEEGQDGEGSFDLVEEPTDDGVTWTVLRNGHPCARIAVGLRE